MIGNCIFIIELNKKKNFIFHQDVGCIGQFFVIIFFNIKSPGIWNIQVIDVPKGPKI